jgi:hypothetical protein
MNRTLIMIGIGVLGVALAMVLAWVFFFANPTPSGTGTVGGGVQYNNTSNISVPGGNNTVVAGNNSSTTLVQDKITLPLDSGKTAQVRDFFQYPTTKQDPSNPSNYHLTGAVGLAQKDTAYSIVYSKKDQSFTIGIWKEPVGDIRQQAERDLQEKLGLQEPIMCRLRYTVLIPNDVNAVYIGKNIGFSFCPGATAL